MTANSKLCFTFACVSEETKYYILYKPFEILSQFSDEGNKKGLGSILDVETDVYPVGRLDADSEGLLLLTNDKSLNHRILDPKYQHERTYYVQVEGDATEGHLNKLNEPMILNIKGKKHWAQGQQARVIEEPTLPERTPPIRFRKNVPTTWLEVKLKEGKNRQVRRMTAAAGLPALRLVRWGIENLSIEGYTSGQIESVTIEEILSGVFGAGR